MKKFFKFISTGTAGIFLPLVPLLAAATVPDDRGLSKAPGVDITVQSLFGMVAGTVVDHLDKRRVLVYCDIARALLVLILFLAIGAIVVYISQYNFTPVTVNLGIYVLSDIPLFYIIIGSLLTGLGLAYFIYLFNSIFAAFTMHGKDNKIKQGKSDIVGLTKRIHQLEIENERLKNNSTVIEPFDKNAL